MPLHNLTVAARLAGVSRSTLARAVRSGKLSTTTNDRGDRCVDQSELLRVFGPLRGVSESGDHSLTSHDRVTDTLVTLLQEQLRLAQDREREGRDRETQLLALLATEQQARRDLELKLLPPPRSAPALDHLHPFHLTQSLVGQSVRIQWQPGVEAWPCCRVLAVKPRKRRIEVEAIDAATGASQGHARWVPLESIVRIEPTQLWSGSESVSRPVTP